MERLANGTRVYKVNSKPGDMHPDGAPATILCCLGPSIDFEEHKDVYGYMVRWDDMPKQEVFIAGHRLSTEVPNGTNPRMDL